MITVSQVSLMTTVVSETTTAAIVVAVEILPTIVE